MTSTIAVAVTFSGTHIHLPDVGSGSAFASKTLCGRRVYSTSQEPPRGSDV